MNDQSIATCPRGNIFQMLGSQGWTMAAGLAVGLVAVLGTSAQGQTCNPVESGKLIASDGAALDELGNAVSISGDSAIVGVFKDTDNGIDSGSAYIFILDNGVWVEQAKLLPSDGSERDEFGYSVSISGDTAVVGAFKNGDNGLWSGSAYIFVRSNGVWTQQTKLLPGDGEEWDYFGNSVSISGDTALVGAYKDDDNGTDSGSTYVFVQDGGVWTQQAKLLPADGEAWDKSGGSVSISGNTAVIGARTDGDNGVFSGSASVFTRTGNAWTQQAKLLPMDAASGDLFGTSVSISGDALVVGAIDDDDNGAISGSAYVFARSGGVWSEQAKLLPSDGAVADYFGNSVSISGDAVVVGAARNDDFGSSSGSAYIFARSEGVWSEQAKLLPADGEAADWFGSAVGISGNIVVSSARFDDDIGNASGSVYVFDLNCSECLGDLNGDGKLDFLDITEFLGAFDAGDPAADLSGDGLLDFLDISAFVSAFAAGCP